MAGGSAPRVEGLREVVVDGAVRRRWLRAARAGSSVLAAVVLLLTPAAFALMAAVTGRREGPLPWAVIGLVAGPVVLVGLRLLRSREARRLLPTGQTLGVRLAADGLTVVRDGVARSYAWLETVTATEVGGHVVVSLRDPAESAVVLPPELLHAGDVERVRAAVSLGRLRRRRPEGLPEPLPDPFAPHTGPRYGDRSLEGAAVPPLHPGVDVDDAEVGRLVADTLDPTAGHRYRVLLTVLLVSLLLPVVAGTVGLWALVVVAAVVLLLWRIRKALHRKVLKDAARLRDTPCFRVRVGPLPDGFALALDEDVQRVAWTDIDTIHRFGRAVLVTAEGRAWVLPAAAFPPEVLEVRRG